MWGRRMIVLDIADEVVVLILGWGRVFTEPGTSNSLLFKDFILVVDKYFNQLVLYASLLMSISSSPSSYCVHC